jgi:hypothetical protein
MTTLSFHQLAKLNPGITYIHTNPGIVKTSVMRYLPWYMRAVSHAGYAVLSPWRTEVEESGERHLEMGFAKRYPSAGDMETTEEHEKVQGIAGQKGAYALYNKDQAVSEKKVMVKMAIEDYDEKILAHTLKIFEEVERKGRIV